MTSKDKNTSPTPELPEIQRFGTIHIKRWMMFELQLQGFALLIFALIYQTRNNTKPEGWTLSELTTWFQRDSKNIRHILDELIAKEIIVHHEPYFLFQRPKRVRKAKPMTEEERQDFYQKNLAAIFAEVENNTGNHSSTGQNSSSD